MAGLGKPPYPGGNGRHGGWGARPQHGEATMAFPGNDARGRTKITEKAMACENTDAPSLFDR
ncbi:hypothetical protein [Longimycelium tulufanense]|uniref:hypothetical protein n=1 Tax=Longimycelium tulufanense TaxID=907463 RepID=UPI001669AFF8|nr:hypothetical protein [Longimycelium tulufanense]